jgi:hypothetical protein
VVCLLSNSGKVSKNNIMRSRSAWLVRWRVSCLTHSVYDFVSNEKQGSFTYEKGE